MLDLNKKRENINEEKIREFLLDTASKDEYFKEKCNSFNGDYSNLIGYCKNRAKEYAVNGVAMINDDEVFMWVRHCVLENIVTNEKTVVKNETNNKPTTNQQKTNNKQVKQKASNNQISIFDLLGEGNEES